MATITGTPGNDIRRGTPAADTMLGLGGSDRLYGRAGDDVIEGGDGNDVLLGDAGDDRMLGGTGHDLFYGGAGNDFIDGGEGRDTVSYKTASGPVSVDMSLSAFSDVEVPSAFGAEGTDRLISIERVRGSNFGDSIRADITLLGGGSGIPLTLFGMGGDDSVVGGFGADIIEGNVGNDQLAGFDGDDRLIGGCGDDELSGQAGNDRLTGEAGRDVFRVEAVDSGVFFYFERPFAGHDTITDFVHGEDRLALSYGTLSFSGPSVETAEGAQLFSRLDTDLSGQLDDPDAQVRVAPVTLDGVTLASTIIELDLSNVLTLFGVTGLTPSDMAGV